MLIEPLGANRVLVAADDRLLDWCASRIPHVGSAASWKREGAQALGVGQDGQILAVMVVHGFTRQHGDAQISMAADTPRWATRETIARLLAYPFGQLGCQRLTTLIPASNTRAIRFNEGLGFKREGLARRGFGSDDCVILGMLREELPYWAAMALAPTRET